MEARVTRPGRAGTGSASSIRSISSSVASESLKPSPPKNLMPLSRYGLCEADSTTPRANPWRRISSGAPGVGRIPPSIASPPAAATPAATAASSISPDSRVSRMIEHARVPVVVAGGGDPRGGRAGERERQLGGDQLAGDAADAVGAEQLSHAGGGRRRPAH